MKGYLYRELHPADQHRILGLAAGSAHVRQCEAVTRIHFFLHPSPARFRNIDYALTTVRGPD
jgi:hypothetical protein